jgi:Nuclear transport factor 2 (NTF2) domain
MMTPTDADLLAAVERSPDAAARHDRAGWIGLFTRDGRVEDPVGSHPHIGHPEIGRFYDTFIAPRQITFHRDLDIVYASAVIRDLDLEVTMSRSLTMTIPAVLRYDVAVTADGLRIAQLRAYWELPAMVAQFLRAGAGSIPAGIALSRALLRHQGVGGALGFAAGFRRTGNRGTALATQLVTDLAQGNGDAARDLLHGGALVTLGDDKVLTFDELANRLRGASPTRVITSGHTVVVSAESGTTRAVLFAEVGSGRKLRRVRYFPE